MFRFLFFFTLLVLSMYGIYGFFSGNYDILNTTSVSAEYDSLLSEALERNMGESERYEVAFITQEILYLSGSTQEDSNMSTPENSETYYTSNDNSNTLNYAPEEIISIGEEDINTGSFGTPSTVNSGYGVNENCKGIIFDPCIILDTPPTNIKNFSLGGTPIYQNTSELSAEY